MDNEKKVYGRDKRLDDAKVKINYEVNILEEHLIYGILESIVLLKEKSDMKS